MALNFKISVHRNSDNLHLRLMGDFDGSSAHQLLNTLKTNACGASNVFIHTNCLKNIHPFGSNVFRNNLSQLKKDSIHLVFTGEHSQQLAPEEAKLF